MTVVSSQSVGAVTVIGIAGRLTLGQSANDLREALNAALGAGSSGIVINLAETEYMDSAGMGELLAGLKLTQTRGCAFSLKNVPKRVGDLLKLAGAWSLFQITE